MSSLLIKWKNIRIGTVGSNPLLATCSVSDKDATRNCSRTMKSPWHPAGTPSSAGLCWPSLSRAGVWQLFPCCGWQSCRDCCASIAGCGFPGGVEECSHAMRLQQHQSGAAGDPLGKPSVAFDLNSCHLLGFLEGRGRQWQRGYQCWWFSSRAAVHP